MTTRPPSDRDRGTILPFVLACTVVMSMIAIAIATYATTDLRYSTVAEDRSDRLSAADAGMRYAIDQLKLRNAACILDTQEAQLPGVEADFNGARASVSCQRITNGLEAGVAFAAVMTGYGVPGGQPLLSTQSGNSEEKVLGGPVFMNTVDPQSFLLGPTVRIEDGPLFYYDPTEPCVSLKPSQLPVVVDGELVFDPDLIFGPACVEVPWTELWPSPAIPHNLADTGAYPILDGSVSIATDAVIGSFTDTGSGGDTCRVFKPGRYTVPPATDGVESYFQSGEYILDFPDSNSEFLIEHATATAGALNPTVPSDVVNELDADMTNACKAAQAADTSNGAGATFYLAGKSHINVAENGSFEIHARTQDTRLVTLQTLCAPGTGQAWCNADGDGGLTGKQSTLNANGASPPVMFTNSGNHKEFVAHAYVYAPRAVMEFGNVTSTATQKLLGGIVVAQLVLQSSASATNFEIAVPTSPVTARILLHSTAVKNGNQTSIEATVSYRPYADTIDGRIRVESWRVCKTPTCS